MNTNLPQLEGTPFLTDGGLETTLIFHEGIELPDFASFPLLETDEGRDALTRYFDAYLDIARRDGVGIVLETPTWRASADWGVRLGYSADDLDRVNRAAVAFLRGLGTDDHPPIVVSGNLGPRGDGYVVGEAMSPNDAAAYHRPQIQSFADAGADLVTGLTLNYVDEAIGMVTAAREVGIAVVIGFTVETDGALPTGQALADAIAEVDAATDGEPAYFMINCAYPTHFLDVLNGEGPWHRLRGIRANASRMSHAELDEAEELDRGDEVELADGYVATRKLLPALAVVGGCCGTDHHHIDAISAAFRTTSSDAGPRRSRSLSQPRR